MPPKLSKKPKIDKKEKIKSQKNEEKETNDFNKNKYLYTVGRRKEAISQIKLFTSGKGEIKINNKNYQDYFPYFEFQQLILAPLKQVGQEDKVDISIKVKGGGKRGQAESIRLALARALINLNPNFRKSLKRLGYLSRDSRIKERKKPGLKRARRAPQWQKR